MSDYLELRKASLSLYPKLMKALPGAAPDLGQVARRLGVRRSGRTILLDDETARVGFMDFLLFEFRIDGRPLISHLQPPLTDLTELEKELLEACSRHRTSFFRAASGNPSEHQLRLEDLLCPDHPATMLSDGHLSNSMARLGNRLLLFTRVIAVRGIAMTSGFALAFDAMEQNPLLQSYRHKMKGVPPDDQSERRFAFFFQKYRSAGIESRFESIE